MELLEQFHGGDPGLRDSLYRMQADNGEQIRQQDGGPTPELIDYDQTGQRRRRQVIRST